MIAENNVDIIVENATDYIIDTIHAHGSIASKRTVLSFNSHPNSCVEIILDKYKVDKRPDIVANTLSLHASCDSINSTPTNPLEYVNNHYEAIVAAQLNTSTIVLYANQMKTTDANRSLIKYTCYPGGGRSSWFSSSTLNGAFLLEADENDQIVCKKLSLGNNIQLSGGSQIILDTVYGFYVVDINENTTIKLDQHAIYIALFNNQGLRVTIHKPVTTIIDLSKIALSGADTESTLSSYTSNINYVYGKIYPYIKHDTLTVITVFLGLINLIAFGLFLLFIFLNKMMKNKSKNINDNQTQVAALFSKHLYAIYGMAVIIIGYNSLALNKYFRLYQFVDPIMGITASSLDPYRFTFLFVDITAIRVAVTLIVTISSMFGHTLVGRGLKSRLHGAKSGLGGAAIVAVIWTDGYIIKGLIVATLIGLVNIYRELLYRTIHWNDPLIIYEEHSSDDDKK